MVWEMWTCFFRFRSPRAQRGRIDFSLRKKRESWGDSVLNCTQVGPGCVQGHHNADVPCGGKNLGLGVKVRIV